MAVEASVKSNQSLSVCGQRLLPTIIDEKALVKPHAVWCSLPYDDEDLSKGYEDITYHSLANAINLMAWFIHDKFGPSDRFETIAYMGRPDIRYQILEIAVAKTGYQLLFSSYTNSLTGHLSLLDRTNTKIVLSAAEVDVEALLAARPMEHGVIPELDAILKAPPSKLYPYKKTFDEAKDDPFVILHTSGTTGLPKTITFTHGSLSAVDHHRSMPDIDPASGLPVRFWFTGPQKPSRMLLPFAFFHVICTAIVMVGTVFGDLIYIPGFRHKMATKDDIFPILEHCNADTAFLSPAMVEDLARHSDVGKYISRLDKCLYGGAPVTEVAGKVFSKFTYLQSQWGMTETAKLIDLDLEPEDFGYCGFEVKHSGMSFEHRTDNLYEMVVRRTDDSHLNAAIFWRCPEQEVFYPGDLWSPHPDPMKAKYVWKYEGRADDLINYKNGSTFYPISFESKHSEHDRVRSAIISGTNHLQPVLLLEIYFTDRADEAAVIDTIWEESIVPINEIAPTSGRIAKTHVILASPDKAFERNVKGTIARNATLRSYHAEIESIYQRFGDKAIALDERLKS